MRYVKEIDVCFIEDYIETDIIFDGVNWYEIIYDELRSLNYKILL